jgi:FkbM family methyltransferase
MIIYKGLSEDKKTIFYSSLDSKVLPVSIKVYDGYTNAFIFENFLDLAPEINYCTYIPEIWKNRKILISNRETGELLAPFVIEGGRDLEDFDRSGYLKKLFRLEKSESSQGGIHSVIREHFQDRYYERIVDVDPGDVVVDIGFNYGIFSLGALNKGASKIYGFEPNKNIIDKIKLIYPDPDKVEIFNVAVSDEDKTLTFYEGGDSLGSSVVEKSNDYTESYDVECVNFYRFLSDHKIDNIDFLKVDCEGTEYEIFECIPDEYFSKIQKIHVEFHFNDGVKVNSLIDKLERNNFRWEFESGKNSNSEIGLIYAKNKGKEIKPKFKESYLDDFLWVVHFSENYEFMIHPLMRSISRYSNRRCVFYSINYDSHLSDESNFQNDQFIFKRIDLPEGKKDNRGRDSNILSSKPVILLDAINSFPYRKLVHIDTDIHLTVNSDDISVHFKNLDNYPLINSHIHDVIYVSGINPEEKWSSPLHILMKELEIENPPLFPRRKCNIIIFDSRSSWFFEEQISINEKFKGSEIPGILLLHDEDTANAIIGKYQLPKVLPLLDIEESYNLNMDKLKEYSYNMTNISQLVELPKDLNDILFFHGFKTLQDYQRIENEYGSSVLGKDDLLISRSSDGLKITKNFYDSNKNIDFPLDFYILDLSGNFISSHLSEIFYPFDLNLENPNLTDSNYRLKAFETKGNRCVYNNIIKI